MLSGTPHWCSVGHNGRMEPADRAELISELDAKAAGLRQRLAELTRPVDSGATIGFGKRIGDGTTQAIQQMTDASSAQQLSGLLDEVLRARAKVDDGSYGRCDVCGEPIGDERLEFRPWSTACVRHA